MASANVKVQSLTEEREETDRKARSQAKRIEDLEKENREITKKSKSAENQSREISRQKSNTFQVTQQLTQEVEALKDEVLHCLVFYSLLILTIVSTEKRPREAQQEAGGGYCRLGSARDEVLRGQGWYRG